jgi:23S rRNA (uracil1939-C5)-methyltransferase
MPQIGDVLSLDVEKPAAGGRMIARSDGRVVFVAGAIPGERVHARVSRVAKGVLFAETVTVLEASPDRVPLEGASAYTTCGGGTYAHIAYERQLALKADIVSDALGRIGRVVVPTPVQVAASRPDGYRMRARFHVRDGRLGFYREGTHELCDARGTRQLLAETCDVLDELSVQMTSNRLPDVDQVEIAENAAATARVVHCGARTAWNAEHFAVLQDLPGVTGMVVSGPGGSGRALDAHLVAGDPYVIDRVDVQMETNARPFVESAAAEGFRRAVAAGSTVALRRHVRSFFQGNRYLIHQLVSHVASLVPLTSRLIDLYAGVGLFAIASSAARDASVVAVEGDRFAAQDLEANAVSSRGAVDVCHQTVEQFLARPRTADVVIIDPPRTGLSTEAAAGLVSLETDRIVYVSCDAPTLARDVRRLIEAGSGLAVERLDAFDLFPNTPHVETVLTLIRR